MFILGFCFYQRFGKWFPSKTLQMRCKKKRGPSPPSHIDVTLDSLEEEKIPSFNFLG